MMLAITVLVDNYAGDGLSAEHGLSLWIEAADKNILFDTGQGGALAPNAEKLGVDLSATDALVLSHGHYDHAGGVSRLFRTAPAVEMYCHPAAIVPRYGNRADKAKPLGMPCEALRSLDRLPSRRMHWVQDGAILTTDVGLTGYIPRHTNYEDTGGAFFLDPAMRRPDPLDDDLALWINTPEGLIVCVGCCHAGLVNTLNRAIVQSGTSRLRAVIGGFHLLDADENRLEKTVAALEELSPECIVPCHCTGTRAIEFFEKSFGMRMMKGFAGATISF